jgi:hypothetical protein
MLTLTEIEKAVDRLTADEKRELHRYLQETLQNGVRAEPVGRTHSVLDIRAVQLGSVLSAPDPDKDLLGEMLEGRQ